MAASAIGTLTEFNPGEGQEVASYVERVELFFNANNIKEEKKAAVFLTVVGPKTYEILRHHCAPKLPKDKTFKEIVTLFKEQFGPNTLQHSPSQVEADETTQAPHSETKTDKPTTDSTQPRTQPQKKKPWTLKKAGRKVISEIRKASDEWEHALTQEEDELMALQELGLGVAIDITSKHPWVTKSAFQAKPVTREELIVINESNKSHRSREQVETYTAIQQGLESSFRPDPTTPINVTVAADFHRSNTRSKTIDSKTILTRTVAFHAKDPSGRSKDKKRGKEEFEKSLHEWLVKKKCYPVMCGKHKSDECGLYSETTNHHCIDYLKELGGVTHYVSSITLGATRYQVTSNSTLFNSLSTSTEVSAHTFASASTKSKVSRKVFQSQSKEQHIGKLPEGTDNILQFRTKGEAVVKCSYNSLANLVSHPQLRKLLELGINEYIDLKKNGTRGPYHIATAELLSSKNSSGQKSRLYWMIEWESESPITPTEQVDKNSSDHGETQKCTTQDKPSLINRYKIVCTPNEGEASNFYLKPIVECGHEKYFRIVTDPEDYGKRSNEEDDTQKKPAQGAAKIITLGDKDQEKSKPQAEAGHDHRPDKISQHEGQEKSKPQAEAGHDHKTSQLELQSDKCIPESKRKCEPQRYVSTQNSELVVELNVDPYSAKRSAFKLKNPRDDQTYPVHKSQWLPEALRGSQPYVISREGKPFRSRIKKSQVWSVYIGDDDESGEKVVRYGRHRDGYEFFVLELGHKT